MDFLYLKFFQTLAKILFKDNPFHPNHNRLEVIVRLFYLSVITKIFLISTHLPADVSQTQSLQAIQSKIRDATTMLLSQDPKTRRESKKLFADLLKKGMAFEAAIEASSKAIGDSHKGVRESALRLMIILTALASEDKAFDSIIELARKGSQDQDSEVRHSSIRLFRALVKKNQGIEASIEASDKVFRARESSPEFTR